MSHNPQGNINIQNPDKGADLYFAAGKDGGQIHFETDNTKVTIDDLASNTSTLVIMGIGCTLTHAIVLIIKALGG